MKTDEAQAASLSRQLFGETPFGLIKATLDLRRFLLRDIDGVSQEWRWVTTAFNLKKLVAHMASGP